MKKKQIPHHSGWLGNLLFFIIKYCGWPDLNRHGIATEGF